MKFIEKLAYSENKNQSMLCVGFDPDVSRMPEGIAPTADGVFDFCQAIVDATSDLVMAYKPQIAYFSAIRAEKSLERLISYIKEKAPDVPVILDAKRGDIGATSKQYAIEAFERYGADAVTLSPFMGFDSIEPYLAYADKGIFLLCRTSNLGGNDFQNGILKNEAGEPKLFEHIAWLAQNEWNKTGQIGLVVGATYPQEIARVRQIAPNLPLLIPGVGAQGGDAVATVQAGWAEDTTSSPAKSGMICVNSSRAILYASSGADFAQKAREESEKTRQLLWMARG